MGLFNFISYVNSTLLENHKSVLKLDFKNGQLRHPVAQITK